MCDLRFEIGPASGADGPRRSWLSVVGSMAIVFGVLNIFGSLLLAWSNVAVPAAFLGREGGDYDIPWLSWGVGGALGGAAIQVLLVASGFLLTRRKPAASALGKTWAALVLAHAIVGMLLPSTAPDNGAALLRILGVIPAGLVVGVLPVFGPPILFWVWLSRGRVEHEMTQSRMGVGDTSRDAGQDRPSANRPSTPR
jgi:hypothetical protein